MTQLAQQKQQPNSEGKSSKEEGIEAPKKDCFFVATLEGYHDLHVMVKRLFDFLAREHSEKKNDFRDLDTGFLLLNKLANDLPALIELDVRRILPLLLEDFAFYAKNFGARARGKDT
jgi:hypothetical protein